MLRAADSSQLLQNLLRCFLARAFLRQAFGTAHPFPAQSHLYQKRLGVLGAAFFNNRVSRLRQLQGLRHFLQRAFVIGELRSFLRQMSFADDMLNNK